VSELELLLAQARAASAPAVASPERPTRETAPGEEKAEGERGERGEEEGEGGRKDGAATPHSPNSTSVELMALQVRRSDCTLGVGLCLCVQFLVLHPYFGR
jgi:hypothetical protein